MTTATNDITGDTIANTKGDAKVYATGYDLIVWDDLKKEGTMTEYAKGTQDQLDAAKDDARLLPFNTVFVDHKGVELLRKTWYDDDEESVCFVVKEYYHLDDYKWYNYYNVEDLFPVEGKQYV